jgi:hypothetical protein
MGQNGWVQIHENAIYQLLFSHLIAQKFSCCEHLINEFPDRLRLWMEVEGDKVTHHSLAKKKGKKLPEQFPFALFPCSSTP